MNFPHDTPEPGRPAYRARAALPAPGFTLIELLMVLAVMAILAALATPSMARLVDSTRLTSASNGFLAAMYYARSEAIKRNGPVALCKSATGLGCAVTGGWEQGWIVFHDTNNNGTADAGELIVQHSQALPDGFKLSGNQNVAGYISFTPSGRTRLVSGAFQAGTLTLCKASGEEIGARQIVINNAGRARVEKLSIASCV
jgi:type IV fimbrial biogenesis protein FimT